MKPQSCKAKGRSFQQAIARAVSKTIDLPMGTDEEIDSRGMGQNGTDIRLTPKARERFPFSVECKNVERGNIWEMIRQAKANQLNDTDWLVFWKKNRFKPIVVLDAETFLAIWAELLEYRDGVAL